MAAEATTSMTIEFLRARLLSERSVSRAAKERAGQLAGRVTKLEEQLRTVTTQRRKAERAAGEVLAILESQGFGRFSDAADSGSDDDGADGTEAAKGGNTRGEAEDALPGSELGGTAAPQDGALSWQGRAASPASPSRQRPQHKSRQLRQWHTHGNIRSYIYLLASDSLPKYQPGQSCRKIKRKELMRLQSEHEENKHDVVESADDRQERSDCTVCTDEQPELDGEVSQNGQDSCGDGRIENHADTGLYAVEKDRDMERVLEKQAALIGQYEAEENAQREWERKFSEIRDSTVDNVDQDSKLNQACEQGSKAAQIMDREVVCEEFSDRTLFDIDSPSECLSNGSTSDLSKNTPEGSAIEQRKVAGSDHDLGQATAAAASIDSASQARKGELLNTSSTEIVEGNGNNLGRSAPSPQRSYNRSLKSGHSKGRGDESSDSGSSCRENARSSEYYINTPSAGSPLSDTARSKISEWSSSCFHNHNDNQINTQPCQSSRDDVGGVLEALQRAKMSLREKLSRPSPPSQDMLALPAPEDEYTEDDLPINDNELLLCRSQWLSHDTLALPASGNLPSGINSAGDDAKVPVGLSGLFRLPTDSLPRNQVCSTDGYGSRFSLTAASRPTIFSSNTSNIIMPTPSISQYGPGFSEKNPYYYPHSSLLSMRTAGGCSIPVSDFTIGESSSIPEIPRSTYGLRRRMSSGDAGMLFQCGGYYT